MDLSEQLDTERAPEHAKENYLSSVTRQQQSNGLVARICTFDVKHV